MQSQCNVRLPKRIAARIQRSPAKEHEAARRPIVAKPVPHVCSAHEAEPSARAERAAGHPCAPLSRIAISGNRGPLLPGVARPVGRRTYFASAARASDLPGDEARAFAGVDVLGGAGVELALPLRFAEEMRCRQHTRCSPSGVGGGGGEGKGEREGKAGHVKGGRDTYALRARNR